MARPKVFDAEKVAIALEEYIEQQDEPLIQEFCVEYNISHDTIYRLEKENERLSEAIKRAIRKQETFILRNASTGKINPVFSIFRLKQKCFGYTDKTETEITGTMQHNHSQLSDEELEAKIAALSGKGIE